MSSTVKQQQNRLLVVDDEPAICTLITRVAEPLGFVVRSLTESARFLETLNEFDPSTLILDLKMPDCDGVELLHQLKNGRSEPQVIVISGMDQRVLNTAEKLGRSQGLRMAGVLHKPIKRADLETNLKKTMDERQAFGRDMLEAAIRDEQFVVHYQPKVSRTPDGWVVDGGEALVRWMHPNLGLLFPDKFLPEVEEYGLMRAMTERVMESALRDLGEWKGRYPELRVAVNVSSSTIGDRNFPERTTHLLQKYGVPGRMLGIELTESTAMADTNKAMDIFLRLCVQDISLSIDDFGTGFSSLQQLYQLPFTELKIDRMFVRGLPDDEEAQAIVRATVGMAHALNMKTCAEGVETRSAFQFLDSLGCDRVQGYLIGRAVPAAEFEAHLGPWRP